MLLAAGLAAGTINTIVGSGSLITFPTLLALGYSPLVANVTNTVGLVPGAMSGAVGYRRQLEGQRRRSLRLGVASVLGGLAGGLLLLLLPATTFERVVPFLILLAVVLIAFQSRLGRWIGTVGFHGDEPWPLLAGVFLTAVYGGYFGAAQGVIMIAVLGMFLADGLQRLNALKNVLGALVNGVAAVLFVIVAPVSWPSAIALAVGSIIGGQVGANVGQRLPAPLLRAVIIVVGTVVGIGLLVDSV